MAESFLENYTPQKALILEDPIDNIPGVGSARKETLNESGIYTIQDLFLMRKPLDIEAKWKPDALREVMGMNIQPSDINVENKVTVKLLIVGLIDDSEFYTKENHRIHSPIEKPEKVTFVKMSNDVIGFGRTVDSIYKLPVREFKVSARTAVSINGNPDCVFYTNAEKQEVKRGPEEYPEDSAYHVLLGEKYLRMVSQVMGRDYTLPANIGLVGMWDDSDNPAQLLDPETGMTGTIAPRLPKDGDTYPWEEDIRSIREKF